MVNPLLRYSTSTDVSDTDDGKSSKKSKKEKEKGGDIKSGGRRLSQRIAQAMRKRKFSVSCADSESRKLRNSPSNADESASPKDHAPAAEAK